MYEVAQIRWSCLTLAAMLSLVAGCADSAATDAASTDVATSEEGPTAQEILDQMVSAYRGADSYVDNAQYYERYVRRDEGTEHDVPPHVVSVLFTRPNKLRIVRQVPAAEGPGLDVAMISDGQRVLAFVSDYVRQVLDFAVPETFLPESLVANEKLRAALLPVPVENLFPQFDLLTSSESQPARLLQLGAPRRLASGTLGDMSCYRVQIDQPEEGSRVLWIEKEKSLLRRMEMPTARVRAEMDPENRLADLSLWIDFHDAEFNLEVGGEAFEMEVPDNARRVSDLHKAPRPPRPEIGKRIEQLEFVNLDSEPLAAEEHEGQVLVLDFWHTRCQPCQQSIPALEKLHEHYRENDDVEILAVSVDPENVQAESLTNTLGDWGGSMPIVRDLKKAGQEKFSVKGWPTTLLLGTDRKIHRFEAGARDDYSDWIASIDALLAGEDLAENTKNQHQEAVSQFEAALEAAEVSYD